MQAIDAKLAIPNDSSAATKACLLAWCCTCFGAAYNRTTIRTRYNIQGNYFVDCLVHCLCGACSVTQEWQHVMHEVHKNPKMTICNLPKGK